MKNIYLLFILVILSGCPVYDPPSGILRTNNKSNSPVYVFLTCTDSLSPDLPLKVYFPKGVTTKSSPFDSSQTNELPKLNSQIQKSQTAQDSILTNAVDYHPYNRIKAKNIDILAIGGSPKKPRIDCKNGQLNIFFFKETTLQHNSWAKICKKGLYEQRKVLTSKQLESDNWEVVYNLK